MNEPNPIVITPEEVVNLLKREMTFKEVYQKILFNKVIWQVAQERGIIVTDEEIEAEANRQRREKHLEKAADTLAWLQEEVVTTDDWELGIRDRLLSEKLANVLFAAEVEDFFYKNKLDFEQVIYYQIIVDSEKLAQEIYYQIEDSEISFYEAAHLYNIDISRRRKCGYEGQVYRFNLLKDIAKVVFTSQPQQLIGPVKTEQGYHLLMVEEFIPAELTPQKYQEILHHLFHKWLLVESQKQNQ
ncbi:peptidylprolyl isomerase [Nostoc sp. CENA543]|uniref:foldase protein PrsA n=1 Tax=Nostoc sp. CENA543 TaxID=1869241 RepID=UPI000CA17A54|nr:peptidylprolyl isomerase [Nostoc sp. CENA543]AUT02643.1 peptidylprolyl isomerase [Nostoc sp. CENA543]